MFKITEKVSFNIASEASCVYILSGGQKLMKNGKNGPSVLPDRSMLREQKLVEIAKIEKFKCDILVIFKQPVIVGIQLIRF